jgi:hypothetical protein
MRARCHHSECNAVQGDSPAFRVGILNIQDVFERAHNVAAQCTMTQRDEPVRFVALGARLCKAAEFLKDAKETGLELEDSRFYLHSNMKHDDIATRQRAAAKRTSISSSKADASNRSVNVTSNCSLETSSNPHCSLETSKAASKSNRRSRSATMQQCRVERMRR